jgi:nucleotide-binding universal stress UspA family protein
MWRDILVFADGSAEGLARAQAAWSLAQQHGAHLEVDVVAAEVRPLYAVDPAVMRAVLEDITGAAESEAMRAAESIRNTLAGAPRQLSVVVRSAFEAEVRALAARAARTADLVVVPKPETTDGSALDSEVFLGALIGGGRPCLMMPRWITPHEWGRRALVAWKSGPEASRALLGALPLLRKAEAVRLCIINPRGEREGEGEHSIGRLITYLMRHDVKVEPEATVRDSWDGAEDAVLSEVTGFSADLVVMGAYSRPRLQEVVFGGMTAAVVRNTEVPVLMWH